tara:strand:+ start:14695 stop:16563 length:1869 start_codon:yes stop_codon:yes gene_type:complete
MDVMKIKKILMKVAPILILLVMSVSCEKAFEEALDRADDSRETLEGVLDDANKVRGMFAACYAGVPKNRSYLYFWTTEEELTDNCVDSQGQSYGNWTNGLLTPSFAAVWAGESGNVYSNTNIGWWGRYWGAISNCNKFIGNIDNVTVSLEELPQAERDLMLDEAIALRAFFYVKLISMYGPLPFFGEEIPLDFDGWAELTRPSYDEIANTIANELQGVIDRGNIPLKRDPANTPDKYRMPLSFVYGLKSRVLLYNASPLNNPSGDVSKYEAAAAAAKQLLDLNAYSLEPFENTKKALYNSPMEENVEAVEVIWRGRDRLVQFSNVHGMNLAAAVPKTSNYGVAKTGETPSQEIVDCYELKNGALVIENYDPTHANPTFTDEAIAAGYDDVNNPYANRDDRFYRDIIFNGNYFGESYQLGPINVWTYLGAPGTGTNGITTSGSNKQTFSGYYYGKDRDPIWYGTGTAGQGHQRCHQHSVMMRYAEIWLNYAEALCGAGKFDEACDALDQTRLRANQPSIKLVPDFQAGNKDWLMKRIRNERRVELVLEDHRFYDVRRWDIISDVNNNTISGMLVEKVGDSQFKHTRYQIPFVWACHNEKYKVLPIPLVDGKLLPGLEQPEAWQ